jgi:hypothetical protein
VSVSIEAQVSQIIVIVVFGEEYVDGMLTIPTLSTPLSCRLTIIPFLNISFKSVATVIVVLLALVPVIAVRREVPHPLAVHHSGAVAQEFIFNTCQAVPLANLVATQSVHQ